MGSFRSRMRKKRGGLKKRHNQAPRQTGGRFPTVFNKNDIPEGVGFFRCTEAQHIVDILPWEAGKDMPFDDQNQPVTEKGDFDYVLDLFVHQNVGKMNQPYVCPYENFNKPCPICEYMKSKRLEKAEWSKIRPKRRSIYLIWNRTNPTEEKKGIQIFDAAHFFMEEKIEEIAKLPRGGGYVVFSDPDTGKSVCWTRKGSGRENTSYLGHRFVDRESPIPDKILDATFSLDQVINMHPSYEAIAKAFKDDNKPDNDDAPFDTDEKDIDDSSFKSKKKKKKKKLKGEESPKPKKRKRKIRTRK